MKTYRLLLIIFVFHSINSLAQFKNKYNNDSIIKRHEIIADSIYKIGMSYKDTCIELKNSYFSSNQSNIKNKHLYYSNYRVFQDTVNFYRASHYVTKYLIYDNSGLDKILDSINHLVIGLVEKKEYLLYVTYNNDSIITSIIFYRATINGTQKIKVSSLVNSVEVSYDSDGKLFSYKEIKNDTLLKNFYYDKRGKLTLAEVHIPINNELKLMDIYYMNSKLSRLETFLAYSDEWDGYFIYGRKWFGKYNYISVYKKGVKIYAQDVFTFGLSSIYMQSPFDEKISFMYFFNTFNKLVSFTVFEEKDGYTYIVSHRVRHGKIKKVKNIVRKREN
jgi:hypothetical protein